MEFLEVPFFDDDLLKLLVRLTFNFIFVLLIVLVAYHPNQKNKIYVFTFLMMNLMVFFICFTMKKLELELGMALGLFAIFSIIRYRTDAIQVKEMTYLFIVIGIAVINALSNKKTSYAELLLVNSTVVLATVLLERFSVTKKLQTQTILFDNLDLLKPDRRQELLKEIQQRTGIDPVDVQISRIDLRKNVATIIVYYPLQLP